jgi:hypothetical protein
MSRAAEDQDLDPRWRALAERSLAPDQVEALRQEAELSDEGRLYWELYRPFEAEEERRIVDGARERVRGAQR